MAERGSGTEGQIKELKVSGHLMALDPGLYCVYNAPGGPASDPTGLPGVRITAAPGSQEGAIQVTSFTADGWIGVDSAALVRVAQARSNLLVTVYQTQDSRSEAPKLQVVLLASMNGSTPATPQPQQPAPASAPQAPENVQVVAHVYGKGDQAGKLGDWMGEPGSQRWIEGFGIAAPKGMAANDIEYQAVLGRGWLSPWSEGGQFCGSRGMSLPILGLRVRLRGGAAKTHKVVLSATFIDGTRIGPIGDGEPCEAPSLAALEAFTLRLEPLATRTKAARQPSPDPVSKPAVKAVGTPKAAPKKTVSPESKSAPKTKQAAAPKATAKTASTPATKPAARPTAKRTPPTTRRR